MTVDVHPTAVLHPEAKIARGVRIGPYAVVGADVEIGPGSSLAAHTVLLPGCRLGRNVAVEAHAVLGGTPQDFDFAGAASTLVIGDGTMVREHVTIHRSSKPGGETLVGRECLIMAASHIGHDCRLGDQVVVTTQAGLAGHIEVGDQAVLGGQAGFHQHVRVGRLAMVAGKSRTDKDVPPFLVAEGIPCRARALNVVGLRRSGVPPDTRQRLKQAFRLLYRSQRNTSQALEAIRRTVEADELVEHLVAFVEASERGIVPGGRAVPASRR
ncbi:MAG: acyl-ACP--UDP-N-acetylglucosamine O-acyltransferase [Myxococcota bacterium]